MFIVSSEKKKRGGYKKAVFYIDNANISYLPTQCVCRKLQCYERYGFPSDLFALLNPAKQKKL